MRNTFSQNALAIVVLGAALATASAFGGYRHIYAGPPAVVVPPVAVVPPIAVGSACSSRRALRGTSAGLCP